MIALSSLSDQQQRILALLALGATHEDICVAIGKEPGFTIGGLTKDIRKELGATTNIHAVSIAIGLGLPPPEEMRGWITYLRANSDLVRHREVLARLVNGEAYEHIGPSLGVLPRTLAKRIRDLATSIGISSDQLITGCVWAGIIEAPKPALSQLNDREREYLRLVTLGRTATEAAAELGVKRDTILKDFMPSLRQKLKAKNLMYAMAAAIDLGPDVLAAPDELAPAIAELRLRPFEPDVLEYLQNYADNYPNHPLARRQPASMDDVAGVPRRIFARMPRGNYSLTSALAAALWAENLHLWERGEHAVGARETLVLPEGVTVTVMEGVTSSETGLGGIEFEIPPGGQLILTINGPTGAVVTLASGTIIAPTLPAVGVAMRPVELPARPPRLLQPARVVPAAPVKAEEPVVIAEPDEEVAAEIAEPVAVALEEPAKPTRPVLSSGTDDACGRLAAFLNEDDCGWNVIRGWMTGASDRTTADMLGIELSDLRDLHRQIFELAGTQERTYVVVLAIQAGFPLPAELLPAIEQFQELQRQQILQPVDFDIWDALAEGKGEKFITNQYREYRSKRLPFWQRRLQLVPLSAILAVVMYAMHQAGVEIQPVAAKSLEPAPVAEVAVAEPEEAATESGAVAAQPPKPPANFVEALKQRSYHLLVESWITSRPETLVMRDLGMDREEMGRLKSELFAFAGTRNRNRLVALAIAAGLPEPGILNGSTGRMRGQRVSREIVDLDRRLWQAFSEGHTGPAAARHAGVPQRDYDQRKNAWRFSYTPCTDVAIMAAALYAGVIPKPPLIEG